MILKILRTACVLLIGMYLPNGATYLHTSGSDLFDANNQKVRLTGVNWFGLETSNMCPHGLWARDYKGMLTDVKKFGFNCIRLPFCNAMLRDGAMPTSINFYGNDPSRPSATNVMNAELQGKTALVVMDSIISACGQLGLKVILDNHSREPDGYMNELVWYTAKTSEAQWIADWVMLATRYKNNATVVGCDLDNEPHGKGPATGSLWASGNVLYDWDKAATRCGNAILAANADVLIFVEGVQEYGATTYWWGGNLRGVRSNPVLLSNPAKLVYSPHEYGPEVFNQTWFTDASFPTNLSMVWDSAFGYIAREKKAPLLVGEFGIKDATSFKGSEGIWFDTFLAYMGTTISWTFWCLNPNSGDTGGILSDDWKTPVQWKIDKLEPYMAPLIGGNATPVVPKLPSRLQHDQRVTSRYVLKGDCAPYLGKNILITNAKGALVFDSKTHAISPNYAKALEKTHGIVFVKIYKK